MSVTMTDVGEFRVFTMNKKEKKWKSETIIQFLELYEQVPCLWDVHSGMYKNKDARENGYLQIARLMNIEGFGASEVKAKIRSIRNTYTSELGKIEKSKKSGAGTDELYTPKLPWFKTADRILHQVVQIRETQSTEIETQSTDVVSPETVDTRSQASTSTMSKSVISLPNNELRTSTTKLANAPKRYKITKATAADKAIEELKAISETLNKTSSENNEFDCFGQTIACQLKKLPEDVALKSMDFIQSYLVKQRLKFCQPPHLSRNINTERRQFEDSTFDGQNNYEHNFFNQEQPPHLPYETERSQSDDLTFESEDNINNNADDNNKRDIYAIHYILNKDNTTTFEDLC